MAYSPLGSKVVDIATRFKNVLEIDERDALEMANDFFTAHNLNGEDPDGWQAFNRILGPIRNPNEITPQSIKRNMAEAEKLTEEASKVVLEVIEGGLQEPETLDFMAAQ